MNKKHHMQRIPILVTILAGSLLLGCDPHVDSIYLGRDEAKMLGDVSRGDIEAVKEFLEEGGKVNLQDEPGMTPLHHAANSDWKAKNFEMVKLLIDRGANVKTIDDTHHTPLHLASNKETAELLIDAGADVNAKAKRTGETPLYSAARNAAQGASKSYGIYLDLTKVLIAKGAAVNVKLKSGSMIEDNEPHRAKSGETTLHTVARSYSEKHASDVCELLIANGAKVNELNLKGQTPLDEALANERNKTAGILRKQGGKTANEMEK
ncbi:MAG: ankyrin repeat domain-containing protein [Verrucomicrobia bacterium]|nr:ankyrin repeat domain-containing protein [Verrucomicrobiota bacterium]MDA1045835.1 ankyrin repeat domain-containing protein [Verrucomicrobiota bacterium]